MEQEIQDVSTVYDQQQQTQQVQQQHPQPQVSCPWASNAPVGVVTIKKPTMENNSPSQSPEPPEEPASSAVHHLNALCKADQADALMEDRRRQRRGCPRPCQLEPNFFYQFIRLMQMFPDVHPATLHSIMSLCCHDFSMAVDKLLYARRYREHVRQQQMQSMQTTREFTPNYQNYPEGCVKTVQAQAMNGQVYEVPILTTGPMTMTTEKCDQYIMIDPKKSVYRSRKKACETDEDLIPVETPKCQLPIDPLSPLSHDGYDDNKERRTMDIESETATIIQDMINN